MDKKKRSCTQGQHEPNEEVEDFHKKLDTEKDDTVSQSDNLPVGNEAEDITQTSAGRPSVRRPEAYPCEKNGSTCAGDMPWCLENRPCDRWTDSTLPGVPVKRSKPSKMTKTNLQSNLSQPFTDDRISMQNTMH